MLSQFTYFFQAQDQQVNLIWWKQYVILYQKHWFILVGVTGISAVNIGGTTIYSGLGIKPGVM